MDPLIEAYLGIYDEGFSGKIDYQRGILPSGKTPRQKATAKTVGDASPTTGLLNSPNVKERKRGNRINAIDAQLIGIRDRQDRDSGLRNAENKIVKLNREELEYILDILVSEGFAVDYEGAECILEAMSDEWVDYILQEAPYDIVHHGSIIDGTRVGPREPSVVKTYKNKKRARNKAEEMNQDYGAHAYSVRYRPEQ